MSEILNSAIVKVQNAKYAFCRFITANDTGKNGSHQAGFYIPKCAAALLFDTPGVKGENKDKMVKVSNGKMILQLTAVLSIMGKEHVMNTE